MHNRSNWSRKCITMLFILLASLWVGPRAACGEVVTSSELVDDAKEHDGKPVYYRGEIIGDIMRRGDHAWINVSDGRNAIGIWTDRSAVKDMKYGGSHDFIGDTVEIYGIFHRACIMHGGDLDIHAQILRKISSGRPVPETVNFNKVVVTASLMAALLVLWALELLTSK